MLAALADAPYYFLTDSVFAWEQIVTFITAALVYYLYVAYAEEVAVEAERGADRITAGGVLHELRQAAPVVPPVIVASVAAITVPTAATGLLVVPGLWLLTRWSLFAPVISRERPGPIGALRRSNLLVRSHFWLVFLVAAGSVALAVLVDRAARRHDDARLALIGLGFLAAALFFGLHAVATPGVLLDSRNGGFALATPVGLALAALFTAAAALEFPPARAALVLRAAGWLPGVLYAVAAVWGAVSLAGLPPLADPGLAEQLSGPLVAMASVSVLLYLVAAIRFYLLYRRRRSVMLLSLITASALLAESMLAVVLASSWHLTWWLWHVLMVLAFGYVG